jgi:hypothetical protein
VHNDDLKRGKEEPMLKVFSFARFALALTGLLVVANLGCASSEVVPSTGPRPPTDPASVAIYQKEPKKYERLGEITQVITPDMKWDERGDSTAGFDKLKALAAQKGGNGLLLKLPEGSYAYLVLAGYKGNYYQVPVKAGEPKTVMAEAIYVLEP